ncbi:MAG TPA: anti-sigma factor [Phenylobacterium sp.]|nr:anti-sigma factor [Phenylobacterium sp.]
MSPLDTAPERLIAYVDGELDGEACAAFEREMAADPALAAAVERHRALARQVSGAYAGVLREQIPPQLLTVAAAANDRGRATPRRLAPWASAAAALVLGVLAGRMAWPEQGPLVARNGALVAAGGLDRALSTGLASQPGALKLGVSFRTAGGRYCRTFESAADKLAGLACRDDGRWVARTITAWKPAPQTAYRTAASDTPPEVLASVDALISGAPLDAAAERAARDKGWR